MKRVVTCDENHIYRIDGIIKRGYSEILDLAGFPKNPHWTEAGREEGTALSQWLLFLATGGVPESDPDPRIAGRVEGIRKFLSEHRFEFVGGETPLYCPTADICCTPDLWGNLDGVPALIEAKRGAAMKRHRLQTACQFMTLAENDFTPKARFALYLKDGDFSLIPHDDEEDFFCWQAIVDGIPGYNARRQYAD